MINILEDSWYQYIFSFKCILHFCCHTLSYFSPVSKYPPFVALFDILYIVDAMTASRLYSPPWLSFYSFCISPVQKYCRVHSFNNHWLKVHKYHWSINLTWKKDTLFKLPVKQSQRGKGPLFQGAGRISEKSDLGFRVKYLYLI